MYIACVSTQKYEVPVIIVEGHFGLARAPTNPPHLLGIRYEEVVISSEPAGTAKSEQTAATTNQEPL